MIVEQLTTLWNNQFPLAHKQRLAQHNGRLVGFRFLSFSAGWRIAGDGRLVAVSPLIDPDVMAKWQGGDLHITGEAALLRVLSDIWNETDIAVSVSNLFGEPLAPHVLYITERLKKRLATAAEKHLTETADMQAYKQKVQTFCHDVERLSKRINAVA